LEFSSKILDFGKLTKNMTKLIDMLTAIPVSTTEPERNFSANGRFVSKLHIRLDDSTINALTITQSNLLKAEIGQFYTERHVLTFPSTYGTMRVSHVVQITVEIPETP
jgi:hypothetical protein